MLAEGLRSDTAADIKQRVAAFRSRYQSFLATGLEYSRGVADDFHTAAYMAENARWKEAEYWLDQAEAKAEYHAKKLAAAKEADLIPEYLRRNWRLPDDVRTWAQFNERERNKKVEKHGGPGPHPGTGTPQTIHKPSSGSSEQPPFTESKTTDEGGSGGKGARSEASPVPSEPSVAQVLGGLGTQADPFQTDDVELAAKLLSEGHWVNLAQPRQVSTLLDRLAEIVQDAEARGDQAPNYDLCKVTVSGSNLFCTQSLGIKRISMPQFSGRARPGSLAEQHIDPVTGEANVGPLFVEHLRSQGIGVEETREYASYLRASQSELVGAKVAGMMRAARAGRYDPTAKPIFITRDNYVLDGHHNWAASVALDLSDNRAGDVLMNVVRLDMSITEALNVANTWTSEVGILPKAAVAKGRPFWGPPSLTTTVQVARADRKKGLVFGWANVAVRKNGTQIIDAQGHAIDVDELEQTAYRFTAKGLSTGVNHKGTNLGKLVESVVFTPEKIAKMGIPPGTVPVGWWLGFQVPPDIQQRVDSGELTMFSIQGTARLEPIPD